MSPSKPNTSLSIGRTRPRKNTAALLPSSFVEDPTAIPEAPKPEEKLNNYTNERLQLGLVYAQSLLSRRSISPRSEIFFTFYKEAIKDALNTPDGEDRQGHILEVKIAEKLIQRQGFLRPPFSPEQEELQSKLLELRELQYYNRYGDYIKIVPTKLRSHASRNQTENWQSLSGKHYWTTIAEKLKSEKAQRTHAQENRLEVEARFYDTYSAVTIACRQLGIAEDLALWSIEEYGSRNQQAHAGLKMMRDTADFPLLAETLWTDLNDIDSTFSDFKNDTDKSYLKTIIRNEIDTWFDTSLEPTNPKSWTASQALKDCYQRAKDDREKPLNIEKRQANKERDAKRSEDKATRLSKKRTASTEEPRGEEKEKTERLEKRTEVKRVELMTRRCQLEEELRSIKKELS